MPSLEYMTRCVPDEATATNRVRSGDQQTDVHAFASASTLEVHVTPSGDVMTRLALPLPPLFATAQNSDKSGDQQMDVQVLSGVIVSFAHEIPSDEVMTCFAGRVLDTAASNPRDDAHATDTQLSLVGDVLPVHVDPSGEVTIGLRLVKLRLSPTPTNRPSVSANTMDLNDTPSLPVL